MIGNPRSPVRRVRAAMVRSFQQQKRFMRGAFSLIVAMHHRKPDPVEAARFQKLLEERLAAYRPAPGVLQKWLQKVRRSGS